MARLLVLWILSERSSYGYEIKKSLTDAGMAFWFRLDDASIYSVLRTLARNGYATEVGTERPGARPQRTRYAITVEGRAYYRQLLIEALEQTALPVSPIDVALAARGDLEPTVVSEALARRQKSLGELATRARQARAAAPSPAIADHAIAILSAEAAWLRTLDQSTIT